VDLELTDDQELFRETTANFLENTCPISRVREWADKEPAGFPEAWWQQGAALGWTSLLVAEEDGGGSVSGHGLLDLILVAEEMGRRVSPGALLPTNVVAAALSEFGSESQRARYLPRILSGEAIATWCLRESAPGASGLPDGLTLEATPEGGGFVLSGKKGATQAAVEAEFFVVAALVDGRPTQFIVDADTPGVTVVRAEALDLTHRFGFVEFDRVALAPSAVLGDVGGAADHIERLFELAVTLQCASMVGAIDHMLALTVEYSFDRYSFGRPLASYQALKHRFADLKLWTEASLATAGAAAHAVDGRSPKAAELVSVAKSYIGDHAPAILQDCVQLYGGIGVTWDHDLHLYIRRVVEDRTLFGTPDEHRERIARTMGVDSAAPDTTGRDSAGHDSAGRDSAGHDSAGRVGSDG
jgi:alkylation response protein AidB-like acyl-CoA dehydrogenase